MNAINLIDGIDGYIGIFAISQIFCYKYGIKLFKYLYYKDILPFSIFIFPDDKLK